MTRRPRPRLRLHLALWISLAVAACMDASGPQLQFAERLENAGNPAMSGAPGAVLADPVRVRVADGQGTGVAGERVSFAIASGGGEVTPTEAVTDAEGIATAQWRLGPEPGTQTLRAAHGDRSLVLTAIAASGPGDNIAYVSGGKPGQSLLPAGCVIPEPLVVRVTDGQGRAVPGATVSFEGTRGGATASPAVVTTDAMGLAKTTWRLGYDGGESALRAVLRTAASPFIEVTANGTVAAPGGYSVIGNRIFDPATCAATRFHGVTRPSLQWHWGGDDRFVNIGDDWATVASWGANLVRLPVSQTFWVPGTRQHDPGYKARVIDAVTKARARGLAVVVDLHASDRGDREYAGVPDGQQMPDAGISLPFWRDVAATFKGDGGVIFELYNEPHDVTPAVWLNGGDVAAGASYPGDPQNRPAFRAVGMQELYNAIRAEGARNLVMIGGLHWGYYLDHLPAYAVQGYNIVYSAHPYDWPDKQAGVWERDFGFLAATYPVIIGEFGAYDCTRLSYYTQLLNYADQKGLSWIAWAWWTPPAVGVDGRTPESRMQEICRFPALITDWAGTPSPSGEIIKARLASYR